MGVSQEEPCVQSVSIQKLGMQYICNPSNGAWGQAESLSWLVSQPSPIGKLNENLMRNPVSKNKVQAVEKDSQHSSLTSTCKSMQNTHMYTRTQKQEHMHTHKIVTEFLNL